MKAVKACMWLSKQTTTLFSYTEYFSWLETRCKIERVTIISEGKAKTHTAESAKAQTGKQGYPDSSQCLFMLLHYSYLAGLLFRSVTQLLSDLTIATNSRQQRTNNKQQAANNPRQQQQQQQPTTNSKQQPTKHHQQQTTNNKQQTTNNKQPQPRQQPRQRWQTCRTWTQTWKPWLSSLPSDGKPTRLWHEADTVANHSRCIAGFAKHNNKSTQGVCRWVAPSMR